MGDKFYGLRISRIIQETFESNSITFDIPIELKKLFAYKPGQFVMIRMLIDGMEFNRPYSMSSASYEDGLTITVKRLKGGIVSNYLIDNAKEGTKLSVKPPEGDFCYIPDATNKKQYYIIGAGSGITPLISIIKSILAEESFSKIYLYYGNRSEETSIFAKEISDLAKVHSDQFFVDYILSAPKRYRKPGLRGFLIKPQIKWKGKTGHITSARLEELLNNHPIEKNATAFLCGPAGMIETSEKFFLDNGVSKNNIQSESFYTENHDLPGGKIAECTTKVHYKGEKYEVVIDDNRSILDNLLKEDVVIPFACRSGLCSSCVAQVKGGKVHSRITKGLSAADRKSGYILSCQSIPTTETLEISYDIK